MKLPKLVGRTVNQAQWALPPLTRVVCVNHKAKDAGMILAANWKVCAQDPAPGAKNTGVVTLTVIKGEETCSVKH